MSHSVLEDHGTDHHNKQIQGSKLKGPGYSQSLPAWPGPGGLLHTHSPAEHPQTGLCCSSPGIAWHPHCQGSSWHSQDSEKRSDNLKTHYFGQFLYWWVILELPGFQATY